MAMVDVDGSSHLLADSQPKSVGLVWGLAATRRSVCIHQMSWVNSHSDHDHEDSAINIVVDYYYYLLLLLLYINYRWCQHCANDNSGFQLEREHSDPVQNWHLSTDCQRLSQGETNLRVKHGANPFVYQWRSQKFWMEGVRVEAL